MQTVTASSDACSGRSLASFRVSNLSVRIASAAIGIPVLLAVNNVGGYLFAAVVAAAATVGASEAFGMIRRSGYSPAVFAGLPATPLIAALPLFVGSPEGAWVLILLAVLAVSGAYYLIPAVYGDSMASWALTLLPPLYVGLCLAQLSLLRSWDHGIWWVVLVFVITWGYDTGAYAAGRLAGKRPFMHHVSPKKTREGVAGGLAVSALAPLLAVPALGLVPWQAMMMGVFGGVAAQLGDLLESMLKRQSGMKDSGRIVPGHGGLLDRIDSLLFVSVAVCYAARIATHAA